MCESGKTESTVVRILARRDQPEAEAPELDWINSQTRLLGKSFGKAARDIQADIDAGIMFVVRTV